MKTIKNKKMGISLIVLVITIIVMTILATAVVITLSNSGIISKANDAVTATNLGEVQQLAAMIWADAYLDGETKIDSEYIKGKLAENGVDISKYNVRVTENGVNVSAADDKNWITIYDKGETTVNGELLLSNVPMFDTTNYFKFTIAQGTKKWVIETRLMKLVIENTAPVYVVGAIHGDNVITFNSTEGLMNNLPDGAVGVGVMQEQSGAGIIFASSEDYQVLTIEKAEHSMFAEGTKLIEGAGTPYEDTSMMEFTLDNVNISNRYLLLTDTGVYEGLYDEGIIVFLREEVPKLIGSITVDDTGKGKLCTYANISYACLYDFGDDPNTAFENDFVAEQVDSKWTLIDAPAASSIPDTVEGKPISKIKVGNMITKVIYNRPVDIELFGNIDTHYINANITVSAGVDPSKIFSAILAAEIDAYYSQMIVDLTALSDIEIPDAILGITGKRIEIYVTEAVKSKYPDSEIVKLK